jgi:predicted peptidase
MQEVKQFQFNGNTVEYFIDYPEDYDSNKKYPVIIYLHGYGLVKSDMNGLRERCPVSRQRIPKEMPFIIVAPLCNEDCWLFRFETMCAFFQYVSAMDGSDAERIYLSGSSMGTFSSWYFLWAKKELFAAAVLCCGGGPYWAAGLYGKFPVRLIHATQDDIVYCQDSEIMAKKLNERGGNAELIIYDDLQTNVAHDVWTRTFTDVKTYEWLLQHKRS